MIPIPYSPNTHIADDNLTMSFENSTFASSLYQAGTPKRQIISSDETNATPESSFYSTINTPSRMPSNSNQTNTPANGLVNRTPFGKSTFSTPAQQFTTPKNNNTGTTFSTPQTGTIRGSPLNSSFISTPILKKTSVPSLSYSNGSSYLSDTSFQNKPSSSQSSDPSPNTSKPKKPNHVPTGKWESSAMKAVRGKVINTELATRNILVNIVLFGIFRSILYFFATDSKDGEPVSSVLTIGEKICQYIPEDYHVVRSVLSGGFQYFFQGLQLLFLFNILINGYRVVVPGKNKFDDVKMTTKQRKLLDLPQSPKAKIVPEPLDSPPKYMKSAPQSRYSSPKHSTSDSYSSASIIGASSPSGGSFGSSQSKTTTASPTRNGILSNSTPLKGSPLKNSFWASAGSGTNPNAAQQLALKSSESVTNTPISSANLSSSFYGNSGTPSSPLAGLNRKLNSPVHKVTFDSPQQQQQQPLKQQQNTQSINPNSIGKGGSPNVSFGGSSSSVRKSSLHSSVGQINSTPTPKPSGIIDNNNISVGDISFSTSGFPQSPSLNASARYKYLAQTPNRNRTVRDI